MSDTRKPEDTIDQLAAEIEMLGGPSIRSLQERLTKLETVAQNFIEASGVTRKNPTTLDDDLANIAQGAIMGRDNLQAENAAKDQRIAALESEVERLTARAQTMQDQRDRFLAQLNEREARIGELDQQLKRAEGQLSHLGSWKDSQGYYHDLLNPEVEVQPYLDAGVKAERDLALERGRLDKVERLIRVSGNMLRRDGLTLQGYTLWLMSRLREHVTLRAAIDAMPEVKS